MLRDSACLPTRRLLLPLGAFLALAVFVFVGLIGGDGEICDGLAAAGVVARSGSRPRRPTRITLLTDHLKTPP